MTILNLILNRRKLKCSDFHLYCVIKMLLIFDVNSEIGVHLGSTLCYFICFSRLIRSRAVKKSTMVLSTQFIYFNDFAAVKAPII